MIDSLRRDGSAATHLEGTPGNVHAYRYSVNGCLFLAVDDTSNHDDPAIVVLSQREVADLIGVLVSHLQDVGAA